MPPSRGRGESPTRDSSPTRDVLLQSPVEAELGDDLSRLRCTVLTVSLSQICLGYNTAVVAGAMLGIKDDPAFHELRGHERGFYQGMVVSCALAGAAIGAACGVSADYIGRRPAILGVAGIFTVGPLIMAMAPALWVLIIARTVTGLGVGVTSVLVNLYISEIAPAEVRGQLGGWAPFLGTSGILLSYIVSAVMDLFPYWTWRIQFGLGAVPAICQLLLCRFLPETPRWLLANGCREQANASLRQLFPKTPEAQIEAELQRTESRMSSQVAGTLGFCAVCREHPLASFLGISINVLQQVSGINVVIYFGPTILEEAGFKDFGSMVATASVSIMQLLATAILIRQVDKIGRRPLALIGIVLMMAGLGLLATSFFLKGAHIGGIGLRSSPAWLAVGGMFVYRGAFSMSLGPLPYIMTSEFFPQEARAAGTALSWMSNWLANFCVSLSFPIAKDALESVFDNGDGVAIVLCIYVLFSLVALIMVYKLLPETRGLQLEATAAAAPKSAQEVGPSLHARSS